MRPITLKHLSFTVEYVGVTNKLIVDTGILAPIPKKVIDASSGAINIRPKRYRGLWDTGATNSVISQRVIDECELKPTGLTIVRGVSGPQISETFLVSIFLPNKAFVRVLRVTKGILPGCDVLIGMDIISGGDFAITHSGGKTLFSFRFPSKNKIDFANEEPSPSHSSIVMEIDPNDLHPNDSSKKHKKC